MKCDWFKVMNKILPLGIRIFPSLNSLPIVHIPDFPSLSRWKWVFSLLPSVMPATLQWCLTICSLLGIILMCVCISY